eukprot:scaffold15851_cov124-Skeletonema_marinoi.AAC.2
MVGITKTIDVAYTSQIWAEMRQALGAGCNEGDSERSKETGKGKRTTNERQKNERHPKTSRIIQECFGRYGRRGSMIKHKIFSDPRR